MTKKIIENIPILTALVVIIGIIKLTLYYQFFSVPIKNFISISEIGTVVANDLIYFLFIYAFLKTLEILAKDMKLNFTLFSSTDKFFLFYSIVMVAINLGLLVWGFLEKVYYRMLIQSAYQYFFFFLTLTQTKLGKEFIEKNKDFAFILILFALTLTTVITKTAREIKSVTHGKFKGTKIITVDTTYISNDSTYYIGQTDKNIFLYNTKKHSIIIPIVNVKQLEMYVNESK